MLSKTIILSSLISFLLFWMGCEGGVYSAGAYHHSEPLTEEVFFTAKEYYICVDSLYSWFPEYKLPEKYYYQYLDEFATPEDILFYNPIDSIVIMFNSHPHIYMHFIDHVSVSNHYLNPINDDMKKMAKTMYSDIFIPKLKIIKDSLLSMGVNFSDLTLVNCGICKFGLGKVPGTSP